MFKLSSLTAAIAKAAASVSIAKMLRSDNKALMRMAPQAIAPRSRSRYLPHQGQREALRGYRRAQGGPGLVRIPGSSLWLVRDPHAPFYEEGTRF